MRRVTRLSKQAIFLVHKDNLEKAEETLGEAWEAFTKLDALSKNDPELSCMGDVDAAFQEYAEAHIFHKIVKEKRFVDWEEIKVPVASYVLGLADVVGELRRRALDSLRKKDFKTAEKCLGTMENIYMELINLDEIQYLASGLRRKCDIARRVIEATRGDITIEIRRDTLENSMNELKKAIEAGTEIKKKNSEAA